MKNLYFRILTRPCFIRVGVTLASNPGLLSFCTQYANDFANPANPVFIPVFPFFNKQWWRGGGGRGVKCEKVESMFNQELTPIGPRPNLILFDPLHCYKKFIHAVGDHHWPRKIYGWSAHVLKMLIVHTMQIRSWRVGVEWLYVTNG